jgi:hydrogenase expression/formation protein HypC
MCQAIPRKVLRTDRDRVEVDYDGQPTWVSALALPDLRIGEYVVVYAGQALDRMSKEEAEELLSFYDGFEQMLEEASLRMLAGDEVAPATPSSAEAAR